MEIYTGNKTVLYDLLKQIRPSEAIIYKINYSF